MIFHNQIDSEKNTHKMDRLMMQFDKSLLFNPQHFADFNQLSPSDLLIVRQQALGQALAASQPSQFEVSSTLSVSQESSAIGFGDQTPGSLSASGLPFLTPTLGESDDFGFVESQDIPHIQSQDFQDSVENNQCFSEFIGPPLDSLPVYEQPLAPPAEPFDTNPNPTYELRVPNDYVMLPQSNITPSSLQGELSSSSVGIAGSTTTSTPSLKSFNSPPPESYNPTAYVDDIDPLSALALTDCAGISTNCEMPFPMQNEGMPSQFHHPLSPQDSLPAFQSLNPASPPSSALFQTSDPCFSYPGESQILAQQTGSFDAPPMLLRSKSVDSGLMGLADVGYLPTRLSELYGQDLSGGWGQIHSSKRNRIRVPSTGDLPTFDPQKLELRSSSNSTGSWPPPEQQSVLDSWEALAAATQETYAPDLFDSLNLNMDLPTSSILNDCVKPTLQEGTGRRRQKFKSDSFLVTASPLAITPKSSSRPRASSHASPTTTATTSNTTHHKRRHSIRGPGAAHPYAYSAIAASIGQVTDAGGLSKNSNANNGFSLSNSKKPFVCHLCGSGFARKYDLFRHHVLHGGKKEWTCSACKKSFARRDALQRHLRVEAKNGVQADVIPPSGYDSNESGSQSDDNSNAESSESEFTSETKIEKGTRSSKRMRPRHTSTSSF